MPNPVHLTADDVPTHFQAALDAIGDNAAAREALRKLMGALASKLNNHAQTAMLYANEWAERAEQTGDEKDTERRDDLNGVAKALAYVAAESYALVNGGAIGRAPDLRPFHYPTAWCKRPDLDDSNACGQCGGSGGGAYHCPRCHGSGRSAL